MKFRLLILCLIFSSCVNQVLPPGTCLQISSYQTYSSVQVGTIYYGKLLLNTSDYSEFVTINKLDEQPFKKGWRALTNKNLERAWWKPDQELYFKSASYPCQQNIIDMMVCQYQSHTVLYYRIVDLGQLKHF